MDTALGVEEGEEVNNARCLGRNPIGTFLSRQKENRPLIFLAKTFTAFAQFSVIYVVILCDLVMVINCKFPTMEVWWSSG